MEEMELRYRLKTKEALDKYKEVSAENMKNFENEILGELTKK
jgi:hypothetical protein